MTTLIVDGRKKRLEELKKYCEARGCVVDAVEVSAHRNPLPVVDLVLTHVGRSQEEERRDDVGALLAHYGSSTWTLCYSGGTPLPAASKCTLPFVAVFPDLVDLDMPGQPFLDMVSLVLDAVKRRADLPRDHFQRLVRGGDELLEAKLDFLGWLLGGPEASARSVEALSTTYSADIAAIGAARPSDITTVRALRDRLFGE